MALINLSYFNGELNIPNTDKTAVTDLLNQFIEKYENELLQRVLGYGFYKDFRNGLQQTVIAQKWVDLLMGVEYTYNGRTTRWRGIVEGFTDIVDVLTSQQPVVIQVGRGNTYDPVASASSVTIPASLQGKIFTFWQRGFGELDPATDYTVSLDGTTLTLTSWTFSGEDKYFYHGANISVGAGDATPKYSFIANYVYYWYMRNNSTSTTDGGEKHSQMENADRSNASLKMSRAWNEANKWIEEMHCYLNSNKTTYDTWLAYQACNIGRINAFSI